MLLQMVTGFKRFKTSAMNISKTGLGDYKS